MDGIALKPLTVSFSEPGFVSKLNQENQFGPWFTLSDKDKEQLGSSMGPQNPQSLNRYSYVLNNPLRFTDPSGHTWQLSSVDAAALANDLRDVANNYSVPANVDYAIAALIGIGTIVRASMGLPAAVGGVAVAGQVIVFGGLTLTVAGGTSSLLANEVNNIASLIERASGGNPEGVTLELRDNVLWATNRKSGQMFALEMRYLQGSLPDSLKPGTIRTSEQ